jgi:hypothetical protein
MYIRGLTGLLSLGGLGGISPESYNTKEVTPPPTGYDSKQVPPPTPETYDPKKAPAPAPAPAPSGPSLCDKCEFIPPYNDSQPHHQLILTIESRTTDTTALLKDNTAENQKTVLTLIVNTAIIGNYSSNPGSLNAVPGILAPGTGDYEGVNLAPYFSGGLTSTNTGGDKGDIVNFLDGGGAEPLKANKPANDPNSNQL